MVNIKCSCFNLSKIAASGQCFRMEPLKDGGYSVISGDNFIRVFQKGNEINFECTKNNFDVFWKNYFDIETEYGKFISSIDEKDSYLTQAAAFGSGIRILKQDLWETLISFIISQRNNIPRIKKCVFNICKAYGNRNSASDGTKYYSFPTPGVLAHLKEDSLISLNFGYRSKYVVRAAREVDSGLFDLNALYNMEYERAKERLLKLYGVGEKVADCVCLFALHDIGAFPIDTHIKKVLKEHYPQGFPLERYKGFAGILQQYMFYYDLLS